MASKILVVDDNQELLSLLTQLFEEKGYQVIAATKGRAALDAALEQRPQAAILDILLPDMMGYQLAENLRKENPQLPVIFMTGVFKGGKHAIEARNKYQTAHYFEKPFEANKLIEVVAQLVPPGKREEPQSIEDAFEVELDIDVEDDHPQDAMELTGKIKVQGGGNLSAEIRGDNLMAKAMNQTTPVNPRHAPASAVSGPKPAAPGATGSSRKGELSDNLPALITAFWLSKETGELGVQRGKVKKVVYFEKGVPVFALSNLLADRFGQFLVRVGKVKPEALQDASQVAAASKRRTGDVLVERGLLKDTERLYYVGQQVKAIIYSLFGWEDGTYQMSFRDRATAESIKLDVHPANIIVRGVKKLYKPERMRRIVQLEDRYLPSLQPSYQLNEIELEKWEAELLPKINGTRTVAELLAIANRPENAVYATLCALLSLNILEKRHS